MRGGIADIFFKALYKGLFFHIVPLWLPVSARAWPPTPLRCTASDQDPRLEVGKQNSTSGAKRSTPGMPSHRPYALLCHPHPSQTRGLD